MAKSIPQPGLGRFLMHVLWPAFLMSVVAVGIVFSLFDPAGLDVAARSVAESRQAAYTVGFLACWALFSAGCALTHFLASGASAPSAHVEQGSGHV